MISDLLLNFRHLEGLQLRNLAPVNIIVGPNNVGKTTLFRGIRAFCPGELGKPKILENDRLLIGSPAAAEDIESSRRNHFASDITLFWSSQSETTSEVFWSNKHGVFFRAGKHSGLPPNYRYTGHLQNDTKIEWHQNGEIDLRAVRATETRRQLHHRTWLGESYFLWHRRKSRYTEQLGAFHASLDSEAEHLTARLDHLLSGLSGGTLRDKINRLMNAVIPGIGMVGITRTKNGDSTNISVAFQDGSEKRSLEDLGGGVEQVLALALVLLAEPDQGAVFLEEPESHLHESAQRRLIEQIELHRGERQVFLATHSPIFVNEFPRANVYRLTRNSETRKTSAHPCLSKPEQRQVLDELGVLPSSLTQTNCVIWVEGPTEVRLVTHWLGLVAPELLVNQHYTFAQTGGSNILSLAADIAPGDIKDWLQDIRRICRHNYFICDRDAGVGGKPAKEPVRNIGKLVGDDHWITHGYEIEWYLPDEAVEHLWGTDAARHVDTQRSTAAVPFYDHLKSSGIHGTITAGDRKTAHAEKIVKKSLPKETWFAGTAGEHLQAQLEKLVAFIRRANQLEAPSAKACGTCQRPFS